MMLGFAFAVSGFLFSKCINLVRVVEENGNRSSFRNLNLLAELKRFEIHVSVIFLI